MELSKYPYDIIIEAGQSNAEGCGRGPVTEEYVKDDDIVYLYQKYVLEVIKVDGGETVNARIDDPTLYFAVADEREDEGGKLGDFALTFAKEYKSQGFLKEGRKLLVLRTAVGGTGFMKHNWGLSDKLYLRMLEFIDYALLQNPENKIVGFLWHQGEHDAFEKNPPEIFESQLKAMITDVKRRYAIPSLPFVSGDFVSEWKNKNIADCEPIVEKIKRVTESEGGAFVETADLLSNNQKTGNGDDIHFCRESQHILGKRYFEAYKSIKIEKNRKR